MKSATVLLAAVTVFATLFLQTSSSETGQNRISDALKKLIYDKIKIDEAALADVIKVVKEALANKDSGNYKEDLTKVYDYLTSLQTEVLDKHRELEAWVERGSLEGRDKWVKDGEVAIQGVKDTIDSFNKLYLPADVQAGLKKYMVNTLIANAEKVIEGLRKA